MKGFGERAEVADVLRLLDERVSPLPAESIPAAAAAGRVLMAGIASPVDVPGFERAAMDGFAVRGEDTLGADAINPRPLILVGESSPARPFAGTVESDQAVLIMTGAPLPSRRGRRAGSREGRD